GHEKGAFTGAYASAPGKFEQANGGTLLLDEISEMELGLQAKLLRVLQEREVERVGGRKTIALNVRVLATTNRNLHEYVREGKFREDLFYRLSVFPMHWRPLRERPLDIVPLAEKLLTKHTRKMKLPSVNISTAAKTSLTEYHWPGNVRELDNALQRALILQQGNVIQADDLFLDMIGQPWMAMTSPVTTGMPASMVSESAQDAKRGESWDEFAVGTSGWIGENPTSSLSETEHFAGGAPQDSYKPEAPVDLGTDLKMREFQIIIDTIRQCRKRKLAAEKLGISPRTLRYKLAQMRDMGIDLETELALS
ncbi:MAG: sigma 54-interacting transcriptional regulator, partial [Pseudomonadales bacterium]|nr:sigma 54-interacting transcriptional regulator [Pseudomonadales bacterium]